MGEIRNITIVGAGTMGHSLAQTFALAGFSVRLHDLRDDILARARRLIASSLRTLVAMRSLDADQPAVVMDRIQTTTNIEEAGRRVDFVIEAIGKDETAKKELFHTLDAERPCS